MGNRDDFLASVKRRVAERAGYLCSNPDCRHPTCGPHSDETKSIITGEAAHICAAAKNGPRYDPLQTPEQRKAISNAIWLCGNCNKKIDTDWGAWPADRLHTMKSDHERWIQREAMIPTLPEISLITLPHLRLNDDLPQITSELLATLREQELVIRNPNRVDLHAFALRMSLPEFVVKSGKKAFAPGSSISFTRVVPDLAGFTRGNASITAHAPSPTTECCLAIDRLPSLDECRLAFYTIAPDGTMPMMPYSPGGSEIFGNPDDMESTRQCYFYLKGTYKFLMRGEFIAGQVFVPLKFDAKKRSIKSLAAQATTEPWHVWTHIVGSGVTLQVGSR